VVAYMADYAEISYKYDMHRGMALAHGICCNCTQA